MSTGEDLVMLMDLTGRTGRPRARAQLSPTETQAEPAPPRIVPLRELELLYELPVLV